MWLVVTVLDGTFPKALILSNFVLFPFLYRKRFLRDLLFLMFSNSNFFSLNYLNNLKHDYLYSKHVKDEVVFANSPGQRLVLMIQISSLLLIF